jgi:hypothetical protein
MKIYRKWTLLRVLGLLTIFTSTTFFPVDAVNNTGIAGQQPGLPQAVPLRMEILNQHLDIPNGARIDYLRIFYYDAAVSDSTAFITTYNGVGGLVDITAVNSAGTSGYGYAISDYIGHIVDNFNNAYVFNWRPNQLGAQTQLCGLRVAYRLPLAGGLWSDFHYVFAAGSTFLPRNSGVNWHSSNDGGCVFVKNALYAPLIQR